MKLKFRGKVPFVISTWCLESSFVEIQNDKVYYDARIDISRGEWTESENIKKVVDTFKSKNTFLESFKEISPDSKNRIKITYRIEDKIGEFYCSNIVISNLYKQDFTIVAENCVYINPISEIDAILEGLFPSDKAAKQKSINLNNIPFFHISEVPSQEKISLNFKAIINDKDIINEDLNIKINFIEYSIIYSGFKKNTREKWDKEGFRIEYGEIYNYRASKKFNSLEKLEDYLGQIGNIITFILDFGTNDILNNNSFISSSQLIGTKGNKVKELNSILGVEFIKEINDYECLK